MQFEDLKVKSPVLKALQDCGYSRPTEIQTRAIPTVLQRKDVMAWAQTGTGKTAAFSVPIIQLIDQIECRKRQPVTLRSLIVTPTRELAIQIDQSIRDYSRYTHVKHTVVFGGVNQHRQVQTLKKGVHILVATPGRLLDLVEQGHVSLKTVKILVLDEADRMLDMGFIHDIRRINQMIGNDRQTLMFSATMPPEIQELASKMLKNPVKVETTPQATAAETVQQLAYYTDKKTKMPLLLHLLETREIEHALLFSRTKHGANRIVKDLGKKNIRALAIHGNKSQNQRQYALDKFKNRSIRILVATDIAARGIDIDKLEYVINYDVPNIPETYVHRIGRSGRAGEAGIAISICETKENAFLRDIRRLVNGNLTIVQDHPFPQSELVSDADAPKQNGKTLQSGRRRPPRKNRHSSRKGKTGQAVRS